MSDPRYTDPRHDPQRSMEPDATRRLDMEERSSWSMWGWAAAIAVIIMIMALVIGYNRSENVANSNEPSSTPPSTTGAAPQLPALPTSPSITPAPAPAPQANPAPTPPSDSTPSGRPPGGPNAPPDQR